MWHDKENEEPHKPEMPYPRHGEASKQRGQPIELHWFMNRPACRNGKESGDWNRKVCCALERVVLRAELRMRPYAERQLNERKADVVSKHSECVREIGPAG